MFLEPESTPLHILLEPESTFIVLTSCSKIQGFICPTVKESYLDTFLSFVKGCRLVAKSSVVFLKFLNQRTLSKILIFMLGARFAIYEMSNERNGVGLRWKYLRIFLENLWKSSLFGHIHSLRAFSVSAPELWNKLPNDIRSCENLRLFKHKLKTYLFKNFYFSH